MASTERHENYVNDNKPQVVPCRGDGGLFKCENTVIIWFSNERDFEQPTLLGGRCPECRRRVVERRLAIE